MTLVTVLIPTHDHADTLLRSVASVQAQRGFDLEILIVGDGAPDRTREIAATLVRDDPRIRFFDRPKGERHGERHRHEALETAQGRFVAYLSDDDLWLPGHLETLAAALEGADLVHTIAASVAPDGELTLSLVDVGAPEHLARLRTNHGGFGPSCAGHTLEAYRRLPHGWRPGPREINSDAWMWIQFLEQPWLRAASVQRVTALHLPATPRRGWSPAERLAELDRTWEELASPGGLTRFHERVIEALARERVNLLDAVRRRLDEEVGEVARLRAVVRELEAAHAAALRALAAGERRSWRRFARAAARRVRGALAPRGGGAQ